MQARTTSISLLYFDRPNDMTLDVTVLPYLGTHSQDDGMETAE